MTTYVIFGGSGFIGTHLVEELCARKDGRVVIADVVPPATMPNGDCCHIFADVRGEISLDIRDGNVEIYNLAAVHRTPGHKPYEYYETNVRGAMNVTAWAAEVSASLVTFTSSISVYGPTSAPASEDLSPMPVSDYGRSKLLAEKVHEDWVVADPRRRRLIILRPAVIFGNGENGNFTRLARSLQRHYFFCPAGELVKACGYVKDLTRAMMLLRDASESSITANFCFPSEYSVSEICAAFSLVGGLHSPMYMPESAFLAAKVIAKLRVDGLSDLAERVLKLRSPSMITPKALLSRGFEWRFDLEEALSDWRDSSATGQFL